MGVLDESSINVDQAIKFKIVCFTQRKLPQKLKNEIWIARIHTLHASIDLLCNFDRTGDSRDDLSFDADPQALILFHSVRLRSISNPNFQKSRCVTKTIANRGYKIVQKHFHQSQKKSNYSQNKSKQRANQSTKNIHQHDLHKLSRKKSKLLS